MGQSGAGRKDEHKGRMTLRRRGAWRAGGSGRQAVAVACACERASRFRARRPCRGPPLATRGCAHGCRAWVRRRVQLGKYVSPRFCQNVLFIDEVAGGGLLPSRAANFGVIFSSDPPHSATNRPCALAYDQYLRKTRPLDTTPRRREDYESLPLIIDTSARAQTLVLRGSQSTLVARRASRSRNRGGADAGRRQPAAPRA